jgi:hypothetical protein
MIRVSLRATSPDGSEDAVPEDAVDVGPVLDGAPVAADGEGF